MAAPIRRRKVLDEVLTATAAKNPALAGITLDRLKQENSMPLTIAPDVPFADGRFPTPSGKVELYSQTMADDGAGPAAGLDGCGRFWWAGWGKALNSRFPAEEALTLLSPASHHFTTSTFANQAGMVAREGEPFVEIHPEDAARYNIQSGDLVRSGKRPWLLRSARQSDRRRAARRGGLAQRPVEQMGQRP